MCLLVSLQTFVILITNYWFAYFTVIHVHYYLLFESRSLVIAGIPLPIEHKHTHTHTHIHTLHLEKEFFLFLQIAPILCTTTTHRFLEHVSPWVLWHSTFLLLNRGTHIVNLCIHFSCSSLTKSPSHFHLSLWAGLRASLMSVLLLTSSYVFLFFNEVLRICNAMIYYSLARISFLV